MREEGSFREFHNHWMTLPKAIQVGAVGKRIHIPSRCIACRQGANAYDMPHRLTINSSATNGNALSHKHRIPWEDEFNTPAWYDENEYRSDLLAAL